MEEIKMERKVIMLTTEKELKIFMDPIRQRVLHTMEVLGVPITAKGLADELCMTPASAKHHLTQLESIGLVEPDHTAVIHGITAKYYRAADAEIRLGMEDNKFRTEREIIAENQVMSVFRDYTESFDSCAETECGASFHGDCYIGVVRLTEQQFLKLREDITSFIRENQSLSDGTTPYEFALIYCEGRQKK
jgi:hypothetical protein